jgi:LacI family transcriptional regulator, sucrose operon repressor
MDVDYGFVLSLINMNKGVINLKKPSIKDVAKKAGVSPTTVSRYLNNRGYISEKTRNAISQAMKEINYYPNEVARSLYTNKTNLVGLIFPTTNNPFFGELIYYIEEALYQRNMKALVCNSINNVEVEKDYINMLHANRVDGIIIGSHNMLLEDYKTPNLPIVAVDKPVDYDIPNVSCDNYGGTVMAVNELLKKGCKKIVFISGKRLESSYEDDREKAYIDVMEKLQRKPKILEVPFSDSPAEKERKVRKLLITNRDIDGICTSDDMLAATVIRISMELGIRIPEDLKVIGFDGTETVLSFMPFLTTIKQPIKEIAYKAVDILIHEIEHKERKAMEINFPVTLIKGKTI